MNATQIQSIARQLKDAHGQKAIAEAAQKAAALEAAGNARQSADWRSIEATLKSMQGPRES